MIAIGQTFANCEVISVGNPDAVRDGMVAVLLRYNDGSERIAFVDKELVDVHA